MNWYYAHNGQQQGPVPEEQLAALFSAGTIAASTLVWREGLADWQPFSTACPHLTGSVHAAQIGGYSVPEAQKDIVVQQMREGITPLTAGQLRYGGFWLRFVAKFIDGLVLSPLSIIFMLVLTATNPDMYSGQPQEPSAAQLMITLLMYPVMFGAQICYNGWMVSRWGATLGKMALGLKVVDPEGGALTSGRAWGRACADLINNFTCTIGYVIAAFDDQKRALHDHICSTRVIQTR